ncbi:alpha/beta hydrolase [Candidatus Kaiserbacteria bacterium]|nr:alpha/beta hydrolase [Candidatus Kaiserbacteria bacterium]
MTTNQTLSSLASNGVNKIFILHGWTYQTDTWRPLLGLLSSRGIDYEFLLMPGLTDGTNPAWTLDDYVKWLEEKTAAYDSVILYGHSHGGRVSLAFAAKHPEKVTHLILEDSAGIPPTGLRRWKRDIFKKVANIGQIFVRSERFRSMLHKVIRESDYRKATPEMRKTMANLLSVDLSLVLHKIQCPTLIIWGAQDATTPLSAGHVIHAGIRDSKMVVIPDARHSPHITHTGRVAELIVEELSSGGKSV